MDVTDYTIKQIIFCSWVDLRSQDRSIKSVPFWRIDVLKPLRQWIDGVKIQSPHIAHKICNLIPAQCPFARQIKLLGRTLITIPPLCKINPLYDELMLLRFRAISYLADECGEDVSTYC